MLNLFCPIETIKPSYNIHSLKKLKLRLTMIVRSNLHFIANMYSIYYASHPWTSDALHQKACASLIILSQIGQ
jgi:hypothetical protein